MGYLTGWIYCYLWYASILAGYAALFCPLLPVLFISNKLYRYCTDVLFTFWQTYPTVLLEVLCKCVIQVSGDPILTNETSILIMNHRTRTDWNFLWPTLYHSIIGPKKYKHSTKFILKDIIRHIPGPGWVMQMTCFFYIRRCWMRDKKILQRNVDYFTDLSYKCSLVIFPEGTDFTESTKRKSDIYAEKNNLPKYEYVLHPKTTGFSFLAYELMKKNSLDAIYDLTLIYPDVVPQNEKVILQGNVPKEIKIHSVRYPCSVLPKTEEELKSFLNQRWLDKEKTFREYNITGHFLHGQVLKNENSIELYCALIFWTLLPCITLYFFIFHDFFRLIVIIHTVFLLIINFVFDGFQTFEISLYQLKKKYLNINF